MQVSAALPSLPRSGVLGFHAASAAASKRLLQPSRSARSSPGDAASAARCITARQRRLTADPGQPLARQRYNNPKVGYRSSPVAHPQSGRRRPPAPPPRSRPDPVTIPPTVPEIVPAINPRRINPATDQIISRQTNVQARQTIAGANSRPAEQPQQPETPQPNQRPIAPPRMTVHHKRQPDHDQPDQFAARIIRILDRPNADRPDQTVLIRTGPLRRGRSSAAASRSQPSIWVAATQRTSSTPTAEQTTASRQKPEQEERQEGR